MRPKPGALLLFVALFVALVRIGLGSGLAAGLAVTVVTVVVATSVAVLITLRRLDAENAARGATPFLVIGPAAIWMTPPGGELRGRVIG